MSQFTLFLLGSPLLKRDGVVVKVQRRKAFALLAYLAAAAPTRRHSRDTLASLFWPESDRSRARASLRSAISTLNNLLGEEVLTIDREQIGLKPGEIFSDVEAFHKHLDLWREHDHARMDFCNECMAGLVEAVGLYRDDFMAGFTLSDSQEFDEWQTCKSQQLRQEIEQVLAGLVELYSAQGEYSLAIPYVQRWLQMDPLVEPAHRQMMRLLVFSGRQAAALKQYQACLRILDEELGIEPTEQTTALYEDIKAQRLTSPEDFRPPHTRKEPSPPFKGLQYFDVDDSDLFFGREQLTARLIHRLHQDRFLAIVGDSGSGKSSLVRAGLVPVLVGEKTLADGSLPPRGCARWPIHIITPTSHPLEALAASLTQDADSVTATATLIDDMGKDPRSLHLSVRKRLFQTGGDRLLIVVDQFEELFTLCRDADERNQFIDNLLTAVAEETAGPTSVILTLRADFYAQCAQYEDLRIVLENQQAYIGQMNLEELRQAIEKPAERDGCEFESGLVDLLLRDLGAEGGHQAEPGALPLLSHALLETWKRRQGSTLTFAGYLDAGGVRGAIATTAERIYNQRLSPDQQGIARNIFLRLTQLGEGTQDTSRRISVEEIILDVEDNTAIESVVNLLAEARLISMAKGTVEVAHEALIRKWPRLRNWLDENREGLRLHRQLTETAQEWAELDRDPGALYRGVRLAKVGEWAERYGEALNPLERAFLEASLALERQQEAEREAQRKRELEIARNLTVSEKQRAEEQAHAAEQLRRHRRYLLGALAAATLFAVVAVFFGFEFRHSAREAEQFSRLSLARELAAHAVERLNGDPELSLMLAVEAVNATRVTDRFTTSEAEVALYRSLDSITSRGMLPGHMGLIKAANFSPDGEYILTMAEEKTHLWTAEGKHISTFESLPNVLYGAFFSPDSKRILIVAKDNKPQLWNTEGNWIASLSGHSSVVEWANFSSDGKHIVTASRDKTVRLWDGDGNWITTLEGHTDSVLWASFSPDGRYIATAGRDKSPRVWDAQGNWIATLEGHTDWVEWASFSPDGKKIMTASRDNTARLWDMDGDLIRILAGHSDWVRRPNFSPDGNLIVTPSFDGTARLWDAEGNWITTLKGHSDWIYTAVFSPDGRYILTASRDGTARLWDLNGNQVRIISGHTDAVGTADFSPDGKTIITGSADGTARLWEVEKHLMLELIGHTAGLESVIYHPNGDSILTVSSDGTAKLWGMDGQLLHTLQGHSGRVFFGVFNPDGTRILTSSYDGTARLWDSGGELLAVLDCQGWAVRQAQFSPDGKRIVSVSDDGIPRLWSSDGSLLAALEGHVGSIHLVRFSPDGSRLVTAGSDIKPRLWDLDGSFLADLSGHTSIITSLDFSLDGRYIVTGGEDGAVLLWDQEGEGLQTFEGHKGAVNAVSFNPDGTRIVSASSDGSARLWNVSTDPIAGQGSNLINTLSGHSDAVLWVGYSPDGKRIATVSQDGTARLWNADGNFLVEFEGHAGPVVSAGFSPDGKQLVTAGEDGIALIWKLYRNVEEMLLAASQQNSRSLTDTECQRYLHVDKCPGSP